MQIVSNPNPVLDNYYSTLANYASLGVSHEQGVRNAFRSLLETCAKPVQWTLVEEHTLPGSRKRPDGTLMDAYRIPRGYWEAKDTKDDLEAEIRGKIKLGYDLRNTIFEDTRRAVLYQNKQRVLDVDLTQRDALAGLLTRYFNHTPAEIEEFHKAEAEFREQIPVLAKALMSVIETARGDNSPFIAAFAAFFELCRVSLNPSVSAAQIEEMLVQHLLTERLFRNVFDNPEFTKRNVIAGEIEKVISALTSQSFSRESFLKSLDYFYTAIENTARTITDFGEKQGFLNTIYERFFQDFSTATADTHGIVYTPQPIVDFMCASVEEVLRSEFGKSLSDKGVTILDPCTGTGNFLVNILRRISPLDLERKYRAELFANEVMLLPYYVASLNIEHAYFDLQGRYETFPGLCFTDTLDLAKGQQLALGFTEENTERVQKEQDAAITVIIGNPPYNVGQQNENDNNKNRKYPIIDERIRETYAKDSRATLKNQLYDAYVKFFRWATDRLGQQDGIVCFVSNNYFLQGVAFDGLRAHLAQEYTHIYHLDLGGNARNHGGGNVFGVRVGIGISVLVRRREGREESKPLASISYHGMDDKFTPANKLSDLTKIGNITGTNWKLLLPDANSNWFTEGLQPDYASFLPIGVKRAVRDASPKALFNLYSPGVNSSRDTVVYDFHAKTLLDRVEDFIDDYNKEVVRWKLAGKPADIDNFIIYDKVKWSEHLKNGLKREQYAEFDDKCVRASTYRPFCRKHLYYSPLLNDRPGAFDQFFPTINSYKDNLVLVVSDNGHRSPFSAFVVSSIPDYHLLASTDGFQCFPLYTYALDGKLRRDNITDWALGQFQTKYGPDVTKRDIFHYVYGLLHSPQYRERYAENLKRELPRIPLVEDGRPTPGSSLADPSLGRKGEETEKTPPAPPPLPSAPPSFLGKGAGGLGSEGGLGAFHAFVAAGAELAALHVGYEQAEEYPLTQIVNKDVPFSWRVTKMRLNKDRTAVIVNEALTLGGIPQETWDYKLGNRSALEWVLDQYQVGTDKRSGIVSDPNRADDPEYIARLVRKVVTVSVRTARLVAGLPPLAPAPPEN